jgi:cellulose synthase (UDP-forming)
LAHSGNRPGSSVVIHWPRALLVALLLALGLRYWHWRLTETWSAQEPMLFGVALLVEIVANLSLLPSYLLAVAATRHKETGPQRAYSVDVFVTTVDEEPRLLRETLLGARAITYPHVTYVLDDGQRPEIRELAAELGCIYLSRADRRFAKAGNLNHGLTHSTGELILVLDADHVPEAQALDRLVGFFDDTHVALVQTTQDFYNLDSFQHATDWKRRHSSQEQELFFAVVQPARDVHNAAIYCGSPALIRRASLEAIGGFATGTLTEDIHTGLRLQKAGGRVLYYNQTVARGLAPHSFAGFSIQWERWARGFMQMLRQERVFLEPSLTLTQQICYLDSLLFFCSGYIRLALLLLPSFCLFTGRMPFFAQPGEVLAYFVPYYACNVALATRLQGGLRALVHNERLNLLKVPILVGSVGALFRPTHEGAFRVTPKSASAPGGPRALWPMLALAFLAGSSVLVGAYRLGRTAGGPWAWPFVVNLSWTFLNTELLISGLHRAMTRRERRHLYRFPVQENRIPVRIVVDKTSETVVGLLINLGRDGLLLTHATPLPLGTVVTVELPLPTPLRARARVTWTRKGLARTMSFESGLAFEAGSPADLDVISEYVHREVAREHARMLRLTAMTHGVAR